MQLLSILSSYVPDVGDFLLLVISILLGFITFISQRNLKKMDEFTKQNTTDHLNIERKLISNNEMIKSMHEFEINPVIKKAADNERKIIDIRGQMRNHDGRITKLEVK